MRTAVRTPAAAPEERPFPESVRLRLRRRVLALDYAGCTNLLCHLLTDLGYEDIRAAGRTSLRGFNRPGRGGWDFSAALPAGVGSRRVVVRLKHSSREHLGPEPKPVHQRCVDELRGACLRAGASEGLLVCTGDFSLTARRLASHERSGVAPVRLVDGEEMLDLLLARRIGVREAPVFSGPWPLPGVRRLELDEGFFRALRDADDTRPDSPGNRQRENTRRENLRRLASLRVTVRVGVAPTDTHGLRHPRPRRSR